ncbi:MAG: ABC transporter permease [Methanobacteriota archaeon]|nr:MAG: ABC transporter permease [Euryarchaeota archaeon]
MAISAPIGLKAAFLEAARTKSGLAATAMLGFLILLAVLVPLLVPFDVVRQWSNPGQWSDNPKLVPPEWSEVFTGKRQPRTVIIPPAGQSGGFDHVRVSFEVQGQNYTIVVLKQSFDFQADAFPSEISLYMTTMFGSKSPLVRSWLTRPDGQEVQLFEDTPSLRASNVSQFRPADVITYSLTYPSFKDPSYQVYANVKQWLISNNVTTSGEWGELFPSPTGFYSNPPKAQVLLMAQLNHSMLDPRTAQVLKGKYSIKFEVDGFSSVDDANARAVVFGTVYGLIGTDDQRRDLLIALLWGAPVALAFGLAGALATVLIQTLLGAISGWYGGAVDELVQRTADFYLIIPTLPILILIGILYRPSLILILFILVVFGVVGATTKVTRSIVLQVKEEQFIEAARSYGASRGRILFRYILPRVMPYTFALIALTVPAFIFLEASLSFLGLGDPNLPTWGQLLGNAYGAGPAIFYTFWWWVFFPAAGIIFTTVAFALLGYAFDKVLNPRLREQ